LADFSIRENVIMAVLTIAIVGLGFFPQSIINTVKVPTKISGYFIKNESQTSEIMKIENHEE
jgi:NADH:ubiquinone oxidoreductase subunit 4 (subunit M)